MWALHGASSGSEPCDTMLEIDLEDGLTSSSLDVASLASDLPQSPAAEPVDAHETDESEKGGTGSTATNVVREVPPPPKSSPEEKQRQKVRRIFSTSRGIANFEVLATTIRHMPAFPWSPIVGTEWWQRPLHDAISSRRMQLEPQRRPLVVHSLCCGAATEFLSFEALCERTMGLHAIESLDTVDTDPDCVHFWEAGLMWFRAGLVRILGDFVCIIVLVWVLALVWCVCLTLCGRDWFGSRAWCPRAPALFQGWAVRGQLPFQLGFRSIRGRSDFPAGHRLSKLHYHGCGSMKFSTSKV